MWYMLPTIRIQMIKTVCYIMKRMDGLLFILFVKKSSIAFTIIHKCSRKIRFNYLVTLSVFWLIICQWVIEEVKDRCVPEVLSRKSRVKVVAGVALVRKVKNANKWCYIQSDRKSAAAVELCSRSIPTHFCRGHGGLPSVTR